MSDEGKLASQLWSVWKRLREAWLPHFKKAGLDLERSTQRTLFSDLLGDITVHREAAGLHDFSEDGNRGIEPSDPARSLFYHMLACPEVTPKGIVDDQYPTIAELNIIENCIYAAAFPTVAKLSRSVDQKRLAIAVFAYEYVPAFDTIHGRHADMCYSRTGIARIGTTTPNYEGKSRGFFPEKGRKRNVHVVPARYGVFIAARFFGDRSTIGPLRFSKGDEKRSFWVPIHKLFPGRECIRGVNIDTEFEVLHVNEKIRRVHLALQAEGIDTGWIADQLKKPPFVITDELADFDPETGLLTPVDHDPLIEPAKANGKYVGFKVPPKRSVEGTLWFKDSLDFRSTPEFVHVRHAITTDFKGQEQLTYLPDALSKDIRDIVKEGDYVAANFVDRTADGYIKARCPSLAKKIHSHLPAYSVIGQPDFFPLVRQQDLAEWWEERVPAELKDRIWPDFGAAPGPLSSSRLPANLTLPKGGFNSADSTMTAIVGMRRAATTPIPTKQRKRPRNEDKLRRESTLSYRAAGLFDPGWDTSRDFGKFKEGGAGTFFMASYGLGSPFAEDTLFCAAFGAFWPGAVPDTTRLFVPAFYATITPLLDDDVGFDGAPLPIKMGNTYQYKTLGYQDYVRLISQGGLAYESFARVTLKEYLARTQSTARVMQCLKIETPAERAGVAFLSFKKAEAAEFARLKRSNWPSRRNETYRVVVARRSGKSPTVTSDPRLTDVELGRSKLLYASPDAVASQDRKRKGRWLVEAF
jgi:hypothetical protein